MITYPSFVENGTIGVTAPSSGVPEALHSMFRSACSRLVEKGFAIECGDTVWTQFKAKSSPAKVRAAEFNEMMQRQEISMVIPPWGGELLIEILEHLDFEHMQEKWILGYSDVSSLLLAVTLKTGIATAHGPNLVDLRGEEWDETTAGWERVLRTKAGETVLQSSSIMFQDKWQYGNPTKHVFHLTETTSWKTIHHDKVKIEGRLLGGCIDIIMHLAGTPYGDVKRFRERYIQNGPVIWYLENAEMNTTAVRRALIQMKLAGWFDGCAGVMFGRSPANEPVNEYLIEDVYGELSEELGVPVIYDIDCGHKPPQITLINGAYAEVEAAEGKGTVKQHFK